MSDATIICSGCRVWRPDPQSRWVGTCPKCGCLFTRPGACVSFSDSEEPAIDHDFFTWCPECPGTVIVYVFPAEEPS